MTEPQGEEYPAPENQSSLPASLARLLTGLLLEGGIQLQKQLNSWETGHPAQTASDAKFTVTPVGAEPADATFVAEPQAAITVAEPAVPAIRAEPADAVIDAEFVVTTQAAPTAAETEADTGHPADGAQLAFAAFGLVANLAGSVPGLTRLAGNVAGFGLRPVRRVLGNRALAPLQSGFDNLVQRGEARVESLASTGRVEADRSRQMARDMTKDLVGTTAAGFADNPGINLVIQGQIELILQDLPAQARVDTLVQALASNYILYLQEHPERVEGLVNAQAGKYIDHLSENPEQVQVLIQGQSLSMVDEVTDELRNRLATADSLVEMLLRKAFRRPHRDLLPAKLDETIAALTKGDAHA
jgi:hypothetical protein